MSQTDAAAGAVLEILARGLSARRVLQIGTGRGQTALSIARALPADGMLITLERDEQRATVARAEFERAGVTPRVSLMIGDARRYLHKIAGPFDLVVERASLAERAALRPRLMQLLREGGLLATLGTAEDEVALAIKR